MNRSLRLLTIKGIDLRLHITFPLILVWAAVQFAGVYGSMEGAILGVVAITLLFVLVTLHEFGHSFAALAYGIPVKQIVLSPIGGIAQLSRMPDKPSQELVVAVAGPAVNVVIALLLGALAVAFGLSTSDLLSAFSGAAEVSGLTLFSYVFGYNIFLAAFNLLPAFPMDGGRIFRALLAMRLDYAQATNIAALVGRGFAVLLGIYGFMNGSLFQVFIALFIFGAASQEAQFARARHALGRFKVEQAYSPSSHRLYPYFTLQQASQMRLYTGQRDFPVVDGEQLVGFLPARVLETALRTRPGHTPVAEVMMRNVQPLEPAADLFEAQQRLQTEGIEALPVVGQSGHFLGLISPRDIVDLLKSVRSNNNVVPGTQSV